MGSEIWCNNILLRNYLRHSKEEAKRYSDLKRAIVASGINTLLAYSAEKDSFIRELLAKAKKLSLF